MQNSSKFRILATDDDPDIIELLQYNLSKEGYEVAVAENGQKAIEVAKDFKPNLILLDVMMPVMDGITACRHLRAMPELKDTFIVFLTARAEEFSEVAAFEAGADDFIPKPIKPRALMSRVAAFVRRGQLQNEQQDVIDAGDLQIDRTSFTVYKGDKKITLPKKEFELLAFLASTPNKVFTRDELLDSIWGNDVYVIARTVDVHIRKVREKVGEDKIKTIKGVGYKYNTD